MVEGNIFFYCVKHDAQDSLEEVTESWKHLMIQATESRKKKHSSACDSWNGGREGDLLTRIYKNRGKNTGRRRGHINAMGIGRIVLPLSLYPIITISNKQPVKRWTTSARSSVINHHVMPTATRNKQLDPRLTGTVRGQ